MGALALAAPAFIAGAALWLSFAGLGLTALVSVALRRPWTADYSRAAFAAESATSLFEVVNMFISGLWGALFVADALVLALHASALATTSLFAFGALVSIFGPKLLVRAAVQHKIETAERYRWPAPKFGVPRAEDAFDVAVVGAGIGGLTAAALLADAGLKVAVFEAHVVPGGYCHTFLRKARHHGQACLYRFDAGPHDFSGLSEGGALSSTLRRLGVADRLDWRRLDHRYTFAGTHDRRAARLARLCRAARAPVSPRRRRLRNVVRRYPRHLRGHAGDGPRPRAAFPERRATSTRCWRSRAGIRSPCAGWSGRSTNCSPATSPIPRRGA